jgi:hypothetical protein
MQALIRNAESLEFGRHSRSGSYLMCTEYHVCSSVVQVTTHAQECKHTGTGSRMCYKAILLYFTSFNIYNKQGKGREEL